MVDRIGALDTKARIILRHLEDIAKRNHVGVEFENRDRGCRQVAIAELREGASAKT